MENNDQTQATPNSDKNPMPEHVQTSQPVTTQPSPPKKSRKPLIIGLVAGAVGLLIILIIITIVVVMNSVSKDDYQEAYQDTREVQKTYSASYSDLFTASYVSARMTESRATNNITALTKSLDAFESANEELTNQKAITKDSEAKSKYETFSRKANEFRTFSNELIESKSAFEAIGACETINSSTTRMTNVSSARTAIAPCKEKLSSATTPNSDIKRLINDYKKLIGIVDEVIDYAANRDSSNMDSAQTLSLRAKLLKAQSTLNDTAKEANSSLSKRYKAVNAREDISDLVEYLDTKSSN